MRHSRFVGFFCLRSVCLCCLSKGKQHFFCFFGVFLGKVFVSARKLTKKTNN